MLIDKEICKAKVLLSKLEDAYNAYYDTSRRMPYDIDVTLRETTICLANLTHEVELLQEMVDTMSDYFPCCIDCEGKTVFGERTDKCVYLIDNTNYCAKRGIENIARILKENAEQKEEIERLNKALMEKSSEVF